MLPFIPEKKVFLWKYVKNVTLLEYMNCMVWY